jgi:hypothetical protein
LTLSVKIVSHDTIHNPTDCVVCTYNTIFTARINPMYIFLLYGRYCRYDTIFTNICRIVDIHKYPIYSVWQGFDPTTSEFTTRYEQRQAIAFFREEENVFVFIMH